jgi:glycosyltransferase involved in cell wall biosynthesis
VNGWPSVGIVMPTRGRPQQLQAAVASVLAQDYPGSLRVAVVCDNSSAAPDLIADQRIDVMSNSRTSGLAGARNTGVLALQTDLIAFCDDDDEWLPQKLSAQVAALREQPRAVMASCGIVVECDGRSSRRLIGRERVAYDELLRSRLVMVHSSTYVLRRDALLNGLGLCDESIPHGQNEDWDLALRAAHRAPITFVDRPLVRVRWSNGSYFLNDWKTRADGLLWMLQRYPEITASRIGAARVYGQLAFAHACLGHREETWRWARRALRRNWHERRVPFALAVGAGLVSGESVLRLLHRYGHGI